MRGWFILLFLLTVQLSQGQENIDSLKSIWFNEDLPDSTRLKSINTLAWNTFLFTQPDSTLYYAQLHFDFAEKKGLKKEMAVALNTLGTAFYMMDNYTKAGQYFYQSLEIKEELMDTLGMAASLTNLGMIYDDQGLVDEAISHTTKAMNLAKELLKKNKNNQKIQESLVSSYNNLGTIYTDTDPELAMAYFINMADITTKYEMAREQAYALNNMANIYSNKGQQDKALKYYQEAMTTLEGIGDKNGVIDGLLNIGILHLEEKRFKLSVEYAVKALNKAEPDNNHDRISTSAEILYESYKALGDTKKALTFHELHMKSRDSLREQLNKRELIRQTFEYNFKKQSLKDSLTFAANQELKNVKIAEQEAQLEAEGIQRLLLYAILGVLVILIFVIYRGNRRQVKAAQIIADQKTEVEKQHQLLEAKNHEITNLNNNLEQLVAARTKELEESIIQIRKYQHDLAHNIRAPYVTLMGLLNLIKDERIDSSENDQVIQALRTTGDSIEEVLIKISKELNKP